MFIFGTIHRIQADAPRVFENDTLKVMAEKNGKSVAQVVLRWLIQRGCAVVPKSSTPSRIKENTQVVNLFGLAEC